MCAIAECVHSVKDNMCGLCERVHFTIDYPERAVLISKWQAVNTNFEKQRLCEQTRFWVITVDIRSISI